MKAEYLCLQAFGSYRERTEVDFTLLGESPLFLITGSTGGGKTTLLDAMCFALYCRSTGGRRSWGSMRNMQAEDSEETFVEFVFSLGKEQYRFRRSRSYYKGRGTGERKTREEHACWRRAGREWELLAAGAESRVREKAEELLGLTCEQFSQVVVLPQGDFLRLLLASSREKAAMFQTLFGAARWERAARRLKEMAARRKGEADRLTAERASLLSREEAETPEQLTEKLNQYGEEQKALAQEAARLEAAFQKATQAWNQAELLEKQFRRREELAAREQRLRGREPELLAKRERLALCRKAAAFAPHYRSLQALEKEQAARKQALEKEQAAGRAALEQLARQEAKRNQEREQAAQRCAKGEEYIRGLRQAAQQLAPLTAQVQALTRQNAAGALAAGMQEGQPCPVCGSVHHPRPAAPSPALRQAQEKLEAARQAAAKQAAAEQRLEQRRAEQKSAEAALEACRREQAEAKARQQAGQAALQSAAEALARTGREKEEARAGFLASLSPQEARVPLEELLLSEEKLAALEQEQEEYRAALEACRSQLREAEKELAGRERPALQQARAGLEEARRKREEAVRRAGVLAQRLESGEKSLALLAALEEKAARAGEEYARTERLAALLSGRNPRKIPLQQFVLGVMLDDVLSSANLFFAQFSSNRYALRRVRGPSGGNALAGLDLEVLDGQSGGARAVETLSGGELFLASLSLAFGLSSVVQGSSGSVRLDSIFIDEGFGSLDQETLDTAMRALGQVQGAGRMVGIISHVSELKSRIVNQICVSRTPSGSSTLSVSGVGG